MVLRLSLLDCTMPTEDGGNGIICGVQDRSLNSILGVHVRAVLDKQLDDFHVALVGGASKGRSPDACAGIDIGSLLD